MLGHLHPLGEPVNGNDAVPFLHRDAEFTPRQVRAEAAVPAGAERNVIVLRTVDVDRRRILEPRRIAGCAAQRHEDHVALLERAPVEIRVLHDLARRCDEGEVAEELLHGGWDHGGGRDDPFSVVAMPRLT